METLNEVAVPEELIRQAPTPKAQLAILRSQLENTLRSLEQVQDELIRQERLASVGQLTKGIVDRILNPLNYVTNFSESSDELISEVIEILKKQRHILSADTLDTLFDTLNMLKANSKKVQEHSNSTARILKDMQKLHREKSQEFVETELNSFLDAEVKLAMQEMESEYKSFVFNLHLHHEPQLPRVSLLRYEFGQAVQEVVNNACYALFEKNKTAKGFAPEVHITLRQAGDQVIMAVRDNGTGISPHDIPQLCNPYFTTKPTAHGTGLGLFMTKDIVESHKGKIEIDSCEGEYTLITITLPAITA